MLCGDHALANQVKMINPELLYKPNFYSSVENTLRYEVFKSKRNWIARRMGDRVSFGIAKISIKDLCAFNTCFSGISFDRYVREYDDVYMGAKHSFKIKSLTKPKEDVDRQHNIMLELEKSYFDDIEIEDVLNTSILNTDDLFVALNRAIIMKDIDNGQYVIMDGTHRLTAYYWSRCIEKLDILPKHLFCFYFESTY